MHGKRLLLDACYNQPLRSKSRNNSGLAHERAGDNNGFHDKHRYLPPHCGQRVITRYSGAQIAPIEATVWLVTVITAGVTDPCLPLNPLPMLPRLIPTALVLG